MSAEWFLGMDHGLIDLQISLAQSLPLDDRRD